MNSARTELNRLCKSLGKEYRVVNIDLEPCIYRDFGNGYDLEVSRMCTSKKDRKAIMYQWADKRIIMAKVKEVPRERIGEVAEELRVLSERLVKCGITEFADRYAWIESAKSHELTGNKSIFEQLHEFKEKKKEAV